MTPEEFQKALENPENKAMFDTVASALGYEKPEDIQGLKRNNAELKAEKISFQTKYNELQKMLDSDEYKSYIQSKESGTQPTQKQTDFEAKLKKLENDLNAERQSKNEILKRAQDRLIDSELSAALEANGYSQHKKVLQPILRGRAIVEESNGREMLVLKDENGLPYSPQEFFKDVFPKTQLGADYKDQPINKGGGSTQLSGAGGAKRMPESEFNRLPPKEQARLMASKSVEVVTG